MKCAIRVLSPSNETVGKVPFWTPTHQKRHSAMKRPLCRRISTMCANTRHAGSGAFLSVFPFRSSSFAAAYCLNKSVSIRGFPTVSTMQFTGPYERRVSDAGTGPVQLMVRRHRDEELARPTPGGGRWHIGGRDR